MNIENFIRLIKDLEALPDERFNMGDYTSPCKCGTAGCIAGTEFLLRAPEEDVKAWEDDDLLSDKPPSPHVFAARQLGLLKEEANHIFFGQWHPRLGREEDFWMDQITRQEAISYLQACVDQHTPYATWNPSHAS